MTVAVHLRTQVVARRQHGGWMGAELPMQGIRRRRMFPMSYLILIANYFLLVGTLLHVHLMWPTLTEVHGTSVPRHLAARPRTLLWTPTRPPTLLALLPHTMPPAPRNSSHHLITAIKNCPRPPPEDPSRRPLLSRVAWALLPLQVRSLQ